MWPGLVVLERGAYGPIKISVAYLQVYYTNCLKPGLSPYVCPTPFGKAKIKRLTVPEARCADQ